MNSIKGGDVVAIIAKIQKRIKNVVNLYVYCGFSSAIEANAINNELNTNGL